MFYDKDWLEEQQRLVEQQKEVRQRVIDDYVSSREPAQSSLHKQVAQKQGELKEAQSLEQLTQDKVKSYKLINKGGRQEIQEMQTRARLIKKLNKQQEEIATQLKHLEMQTKANALTYAQLSKANQQYYHTDNEKQNVVKKSLSRLIKENEEVALKRQKLMIQSQANSAQLQQYQDSISQSSKPSLNKQRGIKRYNNYNQIIPFNRGGFIHYNNSQQKVSTGMVKSAIPVPVQLETDIAKDKHVYHYTGSNAAQLRKKYGEKFLSATEIAKIVTGGEFITKEQIQQMEKESAALNERLKSKQYGSKYGVTYEQLTQQLALANTRLKKARKTKKNTDEASARGTAFHKVVELYEKNRLGDNSKLSAQTILNLARDPKYKQELSWVGDNGNNAEKLLTMLGDYKNLKAQLGLSGKPTTERSLGMVLEYGDKFVEVAGTLDSFFNSIQMLGDFKAVSTLKPEAITVQLNILKELLKVNKDFVQDIDEAALMRIFHIAVPGNKRKSGVYEVGQMSQEEVYDMIYRASNNDKVQSIPNTFKGKLTKVKAINRKGKEYFETYVNGINVRDFPSIGLEETMRQLRTLSPEDKQQALGTIWNTKNYQEQGKESNKFYWGETASKGYKNFWQELRGKLRDEILTNGVLEGIGERSFSTADGIVGGTTVGGQYASFWSKMYRTEEDAQKAQQIIDMFLDTIQDFAESTGDLEKVEKIFSSIRSLGERDDGIHRGFIEAIDARLNYQIGSANSGRRYPFLAKFFNRDASGNEKSKEDKARDEERTSRNRQFAADKRIQDYADTFDNLLKELPTKNLEELKKFITGIGSLVGEMKTQASQIGLDSMVPVDQFERPLRIGKEEEVLEMYDLFRQRAIDQLKQANNYEGLALFKKGTSLAQGSTAEQFTHRLAWLYQMSDIYNEMMSPELEALNNKLEGQGKAPLTLQEYAKYRLNSAQLAQYEDSLKIRSLYDDTMARYKKGEISRDPLEYFLSEVSGWTGGTQTSRYTNKTSGRRTKISEEDMLVSGKKFLASFTGNQVRKNIEAILTNPDSLELVETLLPEQIGPDGKKMQWWHYRGVADKLRAGDIIRNYQDEDYKNYNDLLINQQDDFGLQELHEQKELLETSKEQLNNSYTEAIKQIDEQAQSKLKGNQGSNLAKAWYEFSGEQVKTGEEALQRFDTMFPGYVELARLKYKKDSVTDEERERRKVLSDQLQSNYMAIREPMSGIERNNLDALIGTIGGYLNNNLVPLWDAENKKASVSQKYSDAIAQIEQSIDRLNLILQEVTGTRKVQGDIIGNLSNLTPQNFLRSILNLQNDETYGADVRASLQKSGISVDDIQKFLSLSDLRDSYFETEVDSDNRNQILEQIQQNYGKKALETFSDVGIDLKRRFIEAAKDVGKLLYGEKLTIMNEPVLNNSGELPNETTLKDSSKVPEEVAEITADIIEEDKAQTKPASKKRKQTKRSKKEKPVTETPAVVNAAPVQLEGPLHVIVDDYAEIARSFLRELVVSSAQNSNTTVEGTNNNINKSANFSNNKQGGTTKSDEQKDGDIQADPLKKYVTLLAQRYQLETKIHKLDQDRKYAKKMGEDTAILDQQRRGLKGKKGLKGINEQIDEVLIDLRQNLTSKELQKMKDVEARLQAKSSYDKNIYDVQAKANAREGAYNQYDKLLNQSLGIEKQIATTQQRMQSTPFMLKDEKEALTQVVNLRVQELNIVHAKIAALKKSGLLTTEEVKELETGYLAEQAQMNADVFGKGKGVSGFWGKAKEEAKTAVRRFVDYGLIMRMIYSIPQALQKIYALTQQLDTVMMNLRIVTGYNTKEAKELMVTYQKLGDQLGATTQEIGNSANEWLRQGYSAQEAGNLIDASLKLSKLGMIESSEATGYLTSALKGFKLEAQSAMDIVDKLTKVDMDAAVSAGDIAEALSRTATSAQLAGLSMDEAIGIVSTIGEVTQKSMQSVGESVKTLLSRYGNVKAGVFSEMNLDDNGETTENINDIEKTLSKLGITIRSSSLEMKDISVVLDELSGKWRQLDTVSKNAIATAFAGVRQRENFLVMMENYDRVQELTQESLDAQGTADEKYEAYMDSLQAHIKGVENAWESLTMKVESSELIKGGLDFLSLVIKQLDKISVTFAALGGMKLFEKLGQIGLGGKLASAKTGFRSAMYKWTGGESSLIGSFMQKRMLAKGEEIPGAKASWMSLPQVVNNVVPALQENTTAIQTNNKLIQKDNAQEAKETAQVSGGAGATKKGKGSGVLKSVGAGAVAGLTSALTTTEVNGVSFMGIQLAGNGQSVAADAGDRAIAGVTTGALTALGTAIGGPLGSMIGSVVGDMLGQVFTYIRHKDDLTRKANVEAAQKQLEIIGKLEDAVGNFSSLANQDIWDVETYEEAESQVKNIIELLMQATDLREKYLSAVSEMIVGTQDVTASVADLQKALLEGSTELRKELVRQLEIAQQEEKIEEFEKSKEEELYNATQKIYDEDIYGTLHSRTGFYLSDLGNSWSFKDNKTANSLYDAMESLYGEDKINKKSGFITIYGSPEERLEILEQLREEALLRGLNTAEIERQISAIKEANMVFKNYESDIREMETDLALMESGITSLNKKELSDLTYEGAIDAIAKQLEENDIAVRDYTGRIKDEYLSAIESAIKKTSELNDLVKGSTVTFNDITEAQQKLSNVLGDSVYSYEYLRELLEYATPENVQLFESIAKELGLSASSLQSLVYSADPSQFEALAKALHLTTAELESMRDVLGDISLSDALLSPADVREKFADYFDFYQDIMADGAFTQENLEKIIATYPQLAELLSDTEELKSELSKVFLSGDKGAYSFLYGQSILTEYLNNSEFFDKFRKQVQSYFTEENGFTKEQIDAFFNADNFEQATNVLFSNAAQNIEELREALSKYWDFSVEYEADKTYIEGLIEAQTMYNNRLIDNLQEQKDALGDVNKQRENQLELIKAQMALENAQKEKKRVYREGIGFTYESDTEAIAEAQKKLQELETQQKQDEMQAEIDRLKAENEELEKLEENKKFEEYSENLKNWTETLSVGNDKIAQLIQAYTAVAKINLGDKYGNNSDFVNEVNTDAKEEVDKAWDELQNAQKELSQVKEGSIGYNDAVKNYNTKLQNLKDAVFAQGNTADLQSSYEGKEIGGMNLGQLMDSGGKSEASIKTEITGVENNKGSTAEFELLTGAGYALGQTDLEKQFGKTNRTYYKLYNAKEGTWETGWSKFQSGPYKSIFDLPAYTIIANDDYKNYYAFKSPDGGINWIRNISNGKLGQFATGTIGVGTDSAALINEYGTEAIVTPQGTITALPAKTGIVPADITTNLWKLGEIAPNLIAQLASTREVDLIKQQHNDKEFAEMYIDKLTMTIYPKEGYNMEKFIQEVKSTARISNNITKY